MIFSKITSTILGLMNATNDGYITLKTNEFDGYKFYNVDSTSLIIETNTNPGATQDNAAFKFRVDQNYSGGNYTSIWSNNASGAEKIYHSTYVNGHTIQEEYSSPTSGAAGPYIKYDVANNLVAFGTQNIVPIDDGYTQLGTLTKSFYNLFVNHTNIGSSQNTTDGIYVKNNAAALLVAQQYSPGIVLEGQAWNTGLVASQPVAWMAQVRSIAGDPTSELVFWYSTNNGVFTEAAKVTQSGFFINAYKTVLNNSISLTQRYDLNFLPRLSATDDSGDGYTNIDLATSGVTPGTYNNVVIDAYGRVTSGSNTTIYYQTIKNNGSALTQRSTLNISARLSTVDDNTDGYTFIDLATSGVSANTYTNSTVTVDAYGRVTSASNGTATTPGGTGFFGDGSDSSVTFDGAGAVTGFSRNGSTYTQTRDVFFSSATINNGVTVVTAAFRFFCNGTLTVNGIIGYNGTDAGTAPAAGGSGTNGSYDAGGVAGGNGGSNGSGTGGSNTSVNAFGGAAGAGGNNTGGPGTGAGAAGGTVNGPNAGNSRPNCLPFGIIGISWNEGSTTWTPMRAGAGGGGGNASASSTGGGGGGGGNIVIISAQTITMGATGSVTARGGNGGNATGTNAGGGGGGGGGVVILTYHTLNDQPGPLITAANCVPGGSGGTPTGTGKNGVGGSQGALITIVN